MKTTFPIPFLIFISFLIISGMSLTSCETVPDNFNPDKGLDYFPLKLDNYWVYQMDSFVYDQVPSGTAVDTFHSFLKDRVEEVFTNGAGDTTFRIRREYRSSDTSSWLFQKHYGITRTNTSLITEVDNVQVIELVYPVFSGQRWTPNLHVPADFTILVAGDPIELYKNWTSRIREVGNSDNVGGVDYDDVIEVSLADEENAIELRQVQDKYARGVGLISRSMRILDTQSPTDTLSWEQKLRKVLF
ncbi:MAG: hypothetical protein R2769_06005 [Saprospiraceae bacterium]